VLRASYSCQKTTLMLCVAPLGNYRNNLAFALEYLSENKKLKFRISAIETDELTIEGITDLSQICLEVSVMLSQSCNYSLCKYRTVLLPLICSVSILVYSKAYNLLHHFDMQVIFFMLVYETFSCISMSN
jgi:hypothetical protein